MDHRRTVKNDELLDTQRISEAGDILGPVHDRPTCSEVRQADAWVSRAQQN